jgi:hypothetical protein
MNVVLFRRLRSNPGACDLRGREIERTAKIGLCSGRCDVEGAFSGVAKQTRVGPELAAAKPATPAPANPAATPEISIPVVAEEPSRIAG